MTLPRGYRVTKGGALWGVVYGEGGGEKMREMNGGGRKTAVDGNWRRCAHRIIKGRAQGSEFSGDALGYKIGGSGLWRQAPILTVNVITIDHCGILIAVEEV